MTAVLNMRVLFVTAIVLAAFALVGATAFAKNNKGDTRPGWGHGDKNHEHTGPPGQSVRPHDDDHDKGKDKDKDKDKGHHEENENHGNHGHGNGHDDD